MVWFCLHDKGFGQNYTVLERLHAAWFVCKSIAGAIIHVVNTVDLPSTMTVSRFERVRVGAYSVRKYKVPRVNRPLSLSMRSRVDMLTTLLISTEGT